MILDSGSTRSLRERYLLPKVAHSRLSSQHLSLRGEGRQTRFARDGICRVVDVVQTGGAKAKDRSFALVLLVMVEALRPRQVPLVTATARGGAQSVARVPTSVGIATLGPLVLVALTLRGQWLGIVLPLQNHILTE